MSVTHRPIPTSGLEAGPPTSLQRALGTCGRQFLVVGLFSGVINLLQLTTSIYMMQVFDRVLPTQILDTLLYLSLLAGAAVLVLSLLEAVRGQVMQRIGNWIEQRVAPESFVRAIENTLRGGSYRMEALRDAATCRGYLGSPSAISLYDVPWVPIYIAVVFLLHPIMGWIALAGALVLFALTMAIEFVTAKLVKDACLATIASQRRAEAISRNAEVIDSMGMLPAVVGRWRELVAAIVVPQQRAADRAAILTAGTRFFRVAVQISVLGVGAYLVLQQELTSGASIAGSIILGRALAPVEQMIGGWKQLVQARQSFHRLQALLAQPRLRPPGLPLPEPTGVLAVEQVSYAFPEQGGTMIKAVDFRLNSGESLAIIGPSAAGKTTLIRLLIGTLRPSAGTVRLDGGDIYQWMREDLGRHVGYLPQNVELFDGTVFENIARMGEAVTDDVYEATRLAGCHDMIQRLPQGYETQIGDGGLYLSGGQRQLVGLARALFGRPKFVVLDEPNSNLDGESEARLLCALERLKAQATTVVLVSHRPSLLQGVDQILLLKQGSVEMLGPRAEVMRRLITPARPAEVPAARVDADLERTA
jgi:PrtD family type I secretion system ABC transporter